MSGITGSPPDRRNAVPARMVGPSMHPVHPKRPLHVAHTSTDTYTYTRTGTDTATH